MTHSFTITQEQLVDHLPMIADWSPALLASLTVGMNKLTACVVETPDLDSLAGVVIIHETQGAEAFILPRELAAERARDLGVHQETVAALLDKTGPEWLDVLVLVAGGSIELVFAVPMSPIRLPRASRTKH